MLLANKEGVIKAGPVVNMAVAGVGTAAVVFTIPVLAGQLVGTKSVKIKKVILHNNGAGNTTVLIGTGVGGLFAALLPALDSINGLTDVYGESDLPPVESFANITAYPVALGAGTSIDIQLELEISG